ncbi:MAG: glutamine--fructose-6-phosphate transaminase (isomerizing) [Oscillospiraceae bacterium]|jgi:glucosamine--fructose-6-phosphate aminotransferase (isomerizing)|nr:glutamine--fructose-6-phosphate transaminase (isomerizing) [Oscillospiraceae bacterium]
MCGIIGYIGSKMAAPLLLEGLQALEYRGYDSAGAALLQSGRLDIVRRAGRVENLKTPLNELAQGACVGIAHTRWATHGAPTEHNAHPHRSADARWAVVHNGIIENADALRDRLVADGVAFASETDTEVIPQLLARAEGAPLEALRQTLAQLAGSWALGILCAHAPDALFAACQSSPLLIGAAQDGMYLASDAAAFGDDVFALYRLNDGEMAVLRADSVAFYDSEGAPVRKEAAPFSRRAHGSDKGMYTHYMRKEIDEQPDAVRRTLAQFFSDAGALRLPALLPSSPRRVFLIACGSAYHACVTAKYVIEELAAVPCEAWVASEFRYAMPLIGKGDVAVFVSQSGETADTLAALRLATVHGAHTVGIVNVPDSAIARACALVLPTLAGAEIAVATTKAYSAQLAVLYALAAHWAQAGGQECTDFLDELRRLPEKISAALTSEARAKAVAQEIHKEEHAYFIGRGVDYATALEGSLKLKEISYLHSEAYPAGELKHGTISLIAPGTPVIALACTARLLPKTAANIREVTARGARVFALTGAGADQNTLDAEQIIAVPTAHPLLMPSLSVIPLQLLAYHVAALRGCDIDKPKNLAKSVTVE